MNPFRRHRHAPEIVSVGHYEYVLFSSPVTVVLYRCVDLIRRLRAYRERVDREHEEDMAFQTPDSLATFDTLHTVLAAAKDVNR